MSETVSANETRATEAAIKARFELAATIALEAGRHAFAAWKERDQLTIDAKTSAQDVVSNADKETETLIRARVGAAFPDDGFIGEEFGESPGHSGFVWVLDPIDGTSPFVFGLPSWCVSIAVMLQDDVKIGIIHAPVRDETFKAMSGKGAWLNDVPLRLDPNRTLTDGLLGVGANLRVDPALIASFIERLMRAGGMFIRNGSGALMLAYVAAGRLVGYYEPHINAWDCLAGLCLIREAGGWTERFPHAAPLLSGSRIIAATPAARAQLLDLIAA
ncbi:myo-inositol-1(or 4)-monophosphatase [Arboricoccus pini]|uniref:Inositol-1-monophosphatase n=1 Tax=Arboricoccus pini TaxID=1963835 RepID=A0A212RNV2_9PROT|nr:inositol monophosphatase [Arboricoccus pini]SNB74217.1 myo-inositol-1(or 4)-monophosphatase [Arboricoccus pini]